MRTRRSSPAPRVSFEGGGQFFQETRKEVERYLESGGARRRALHQLYAKTVIGFALLLGAWAYLVLADPTLWKAVLGFAGLLLGSVVVSVCVLHDANHAAFFQSTRANYLLGWSVDVFLGFGSYAWRVKHNIAHHTYPNVDGYDDDIDHAPFARLAPSQKAHAWYRWQHLYIWPLYATALLRWHATDIMTFKRGRVASSELPFPRRWDLAGVLVGKMLFIGWAFVVPMLIYPWWIVVSAYLAFTLTGSFLMAVVFQLAHAVEEAEFVSPAELSETRRSWAVHEVESTVDFCQSNRVLTWLIGGLNYQIEHHLFPRLPHTVYPYIAPIVRRNAERYGVRYTAQPTLRVALRSHYRHLREMGRNGVAAEIEMG